MYGHLITAARSYAKLTQKEFAKLTGVKYSYLANIESERVPFTIKRANKLLKFINYKIQISAKLVKTNENKK